MNTEAMPRVLTAKECLKVFEETIPIIIDPKLAQRMWRARMVIHKYAYFEHIDFGTIQANNMEELNLQAQWKIACCYHAVSVGEMTDEEAFSWMDIVEWAAYEESLVPVEEDDDTDTYTDSNGITWPYMIMFGDPIYDEDK